MMTMAMEKKTPNKNFELGMVGCFSPWPWHAMSLTPRSPASPRRPKDLLRGFTGDSPATGNGTSIDDSLLKDRMCLEMKVS